MLSKLLKTIKSQRSEQSSVNQKKQVQQYHQKEKQQSITDFKLSNRVIEDLASNKTQVNGKVKKIRYAVIDNLPNMMNQVLGCPISVFHYLPHGQRKVKQIDLTKHPLPSYLQLMQPLLERELPTFNHLLINDYPAGIGIMPHSDGPAYLPKVVVLSIGSYCLINFQKAYSSQSQVKQQQEQQLQQQNNKQNTDNNLVCRVLLQPNSIHIFEQQAYTQNLHGIQNYAIDSVLLKYDYNQKRVVNANIANYDLLECRHQIQDIIQSMNIQKQQQKQVQAQSVQKKVEKQRQFGDMRIIALYQNSEFTHKIQIKRRERVSITIREQYKLK